MKREFVDAWVEALRSGKYKQGKRFLQSANSEFCCLGVFCDLNGAKKARVDTERVYYKDPETEVSAALPTSMVKLGGFFDALGTFRVPMIPIKVGGRELRFASLSTMNDSGISFEKIADVIEERYADL